MTLVLTPFALDGSLSDTSIATWLRDNKLHGDTPISFAGVERISPQFLDTLFAKVTDVDALIERIEMDSISPAVSSVLEAWLEEREKIEKASKRGRINPTAAWKKNASKPATLSVGREEEGRRYTPTRLFHTLKRQLRDYIESAYPLKHPALIRARRDILDNADEGRLIAQEPFIETTPRYPIAEHKPPRPGKRAPDYQSFQDFGLPEPLGPFYNRVAELPVDPPVAKKTLLYRTVYEHQKKAIQTYFVDRKDIIVATGTGSGKTECFLLPLLGKLYQEAAEAPERFTEPGIRALILYPMNALVNDQLSRLRLLFGNPHLREVFHELPGNEGRHPLFGMYTSRTRYPGPRQSGKDSSRVGPLLDYYLSLERDPTLEHELRSRGRYPAKDIDAFLAEHLAQEKVYGPKAKKAGQTYTAHHWDKRLLTGPNDSELLTRHEMVYDPRTQQGGAPDILVTNYSMLEYMLMRPFERPLFEQTRKWLEHEDSEFLLVIDEAHMYRGAPGAEVAFLIRRMLARLGLTGKPHKFRVIATSASLGEGEEARRTVKRFAADLTGKRPDDFKVVQSRRAVPEGGAPGSSELAEVLADVDLEALHEADSPASLRDTLSGLFEHTGGPPTSAETEDDIFTLLYNRLKELAPVKLVLAETSGEAKALDAMARQVFPNAEEPRLAMEVLLTLGTLAREAPNEPGLIPTRMHMLFRGINGLYACINPHCDGMREFRRGQSAPLGKLFTAPRVHCDACGGRVFELASCRNCGTAYVQARVPRDQKLVALHYLWNETEGELETLQLLPENIDHPLCEEIRVDIKSGFVDTTQNMAYRGTRSLRMPLDPKAGGRCHAFGRCPECQDHPSERAKINPLKTWGEQPFTALIEAQFVEQPPQGKSTPERPLPNRGRKVLVFSDGRQKAARLAPALESSHSRDAFRQVLLLAAQALRDAKKPTRLSKLYPAVLWVCHERGVNLFLETESNELPGHIELARERSLEELLDIGLAEQSDYARKLYEELTDPFYSLWSLGLATVSPNPLVISTLFKTFPHLSSEDARIVLQHWIRAQLERRCFLPPNASVLGLTDDIGNRPRSMQPHKENTLFPRRFKRYLEHIVPNKRQREDVFAWFKELVTRNYLTRSVENGRYLRTDALLLNPRLEDEWLRCPSCNRLSVDHIDKICSFCRGALESIDHEPLLIEARSGFYRNKVLRALEGQGLEPISEQLSVII